MRIILCAALIYLCTVAYGQPQSTYSRVKIDLTSANARDFVRGGFDMEHGLYIPGRLYIGDMADWEIEQVDALGFETTVLIEDVSAYYANQKARRAPLVCQSYDYPYNVPSNFQYGSMGGYLTYAELIDQLDLMALQYPGIITQRAQVGSQLTHQGRKIEWVRISDNAVEDEDEPEILFTALHHAREPMSMMQMVYYMWYLLENYKVDPEITYLVDNIEMYFVPCVNPDGYIYNQQTNPDGGGNWRKNMRDNNGDDVFTEKEDGVDLNRNYGFEWAADDEGSSSVTGSVTYRGDEPFSEPETSNISEFVRERDFVLALNYHSFGNYLLFPWGFSGERNPDSTTFANFGEILAKRSGYPAGTTKETLGYLANGVATDWMYAAHDIKAFTPELGDADWGFWPPQDQIIGLCNASLYKNMTTSHLSLRYAVATQLSSDYLTSSTGKIDVMVKRYGLKNGTMALSAESLSPELEIEGFLREVGFSNFNDEVYSFNYTLNDEAEQGGEYSFVIKLDNGDFEILDTITQLYSTADAVFLSDGETTELWNISALSSWGVSDEYAFSGENSLTDSPNSPYGKSLVNEMQVAEPIDLKDALSAELRFKARWEIEEIIDYATVELSIDGVNYFPLCGEHSKSGSIFQLTGEPIYDGFQDEWVEEVIDLTDYIGEEIYLQFVLVSDGYFELDGFYVDDIEIVTYNADQTTSTEEILRSDFSFEQYPNPTSAELFIKTSTTQNHQISYPLDVTIYNSVGQIQHRTQIQSEDELVSISTDDWAAGIYSTTLTKNGAILRTGRVVVTH